MRATAHIRKRRKRSTRGAIYGEMVVLLPAMFLMWWGIDYFRQGYARRLDTMSQSHAAMWKKAYSNDGSCFAGAGRFTGWDNSKDGDMKSSESGESMKDDFSSMFMWGHADGPASQATKGMQWSATVKSNSYITCNEAVPKDDQNVWSPLGSFIKSFIQF